MGFDQAPKEVRLVFFAVGDAGIFLKHHEFTS
jgi:hypothetical protein